MNLKTGQKLEFTGTVSDRQVIRPDNGQAFVKASLLIEGEEDTLPVVWWDAGRAPKMGCAGSCWRHCSRL